MPCCLFYCPVAFQRDQKPFKRVIVIKKVIVKVITPHNESLGCLWPCVARVFVGFRGKELREKK